MPDLDDQTLYLNPRYHCYLVLEDNLVVFLDEVQSVLLRGPEAVHLIPFIDGTRNLVDLAYEVQQQVDPKVTFALISLLTDQEIVEVNREGKELRFPRAGITAVE